MLWDDAVYSGFEGRWVYRRLHPKGAAFGLRMFLSAPLNWWFQRVRNAEQSTDDSSDRERVAAGVRFRLFGLGGVEGALEPIRLHVGRHAQRPCVRRRQRRDLDARGVGDKAFV